VCLVRTPYKCLSCRLVNPMGSLTCQACGASLTGSAPPDAAGTSPPSRSRVASSLPAQPTAGSLGALSKPAASPIAAGATHASGASSGLSALDPFGWTSLDGRVVHVEPLYMGTPDFRWRRLLLTLAIAGWAVYACSLLCGVLLLAMLALLLLVVRMVGRMFRGGFLSAVAVRVASFVLTRRLLGPAATVPIRDCRVRDSNGDETLVRMKGQLTSGSLTVGDDVHVEGLRRGGILLFRRGYNNRIRAEIRVKRV